MNNIPRRARIDQLTSGELAIRNALLAVEEMGADPRLTEAVNLLQEARDRVADFVEGKPYATATDSEIEAMADHHWELGRGKHRYLLIDLGDHWTLREMTRDSVMPPCDKNTPREIAGRLLQLLQTGPVAPQSFPEEICVSEINGKRVGSAND